MTILFYSSDDNDGSLLSAIRDHLPSFQVDQWPSIDSPDKVKYAIVWHAPEQLFDGLTQLQGIFSLGAGIDHLLSHSALPDVPVIRLSDAGMADKIADYVLYGVLRAHRHFGLYEKQQTNSTWLPQSETDTDQYRVGIMGMGVIGTRIARRLTDSGYNVSGWKRTPVPDCEFSIYHGTNQLTEFLTPLNTLVCILPLTPQTRGIVDRHVFNLLPKGAQFINVGRGDHVNEADLLTALDDGQLSSAMLDVVANEPLPVENSLWKHPAVLLTPHIAGPTQAQLSAQQIAESLRQLESGQSPAGLVNRSNGY